MRTLIESFTRLYRNIVSWRQGRHARRRDREFIRGYGWAQEETKRSGEMVVAAYICGQTDAFDRGAAQYLRDIGFENPYKEGCGL